MKLRMFKKFLALIILGVFCVNSHINTLSNASLSTRIEKTAAHLTPQLLLPSRQGYFDYVSLDRTLKALGVKAGSPEAGYIENNIQLAIKTGLIQTETLSGERMFFKDDVIAFVTAHLNRQFTLDINSLAVTYITLENACALLGMTKRQLSKAVKSAKIPYYNVRINKKKHTIFLLEQIQSLLPKPEPAQLEYTDEDLINLFGEIPHTMPGNMADCKSSCSAPRAATILHKEEAEILVMASSGMLKYYINEKGKIVVDRADLEALKDIKQELPTVVVDEQELIPTPDSRAPAGTSDKVGEDGVKDKITFKEEGQDVPAQRNGAGTGFAFSLHPVQAEADGQPGITQALPNTKAVRIPSSVPVYTREQAIEVYGGNEDAFDQAILAGDIRQYWIFEEEGVVFKKDEIDLIKETYITPQVARDMLQLEPDEFNALMKQLVADKEIKQWQKKRDKKAGNGNVVYKKEDIMALKNAQMNLVTVIVPEHDLLEQAPGPDASEDLEVVALPYSVEKKQSQIDWYKKQGERTRAVEKQTRENGRAQRIWDFYNQSNWTALLGEFKLAGIEPGNIEHCKIPCTIAQAARRFDITEKKLLESILNGQIPYYEQEDRILLHSHEVLIALLKEKGIMPASGEPTMELNLEDLKTSLPGITEQEVIGKLKDRKIPYYVINGVIVLDRIDVGHKAYQLNIGATMSSVDETLLIPAAPAPQTPGKQVSEDEQIIAELQAEWIQPGNLKDCKQQLTIKQALKSLKSIGINTPQDIVQNITKGNIPNYYIKDNTVILDRMDLWACSLIFALSKKGINLELRPAGLIPYTLAETIDLLEINVGKALEKIIKKRFKPYKGEKDRGIIFDGREVWAYYMIPRLTDAKIKPVKLETLKDPITIDQAVLYFGLSPKDLFEMIKDPANSVNFAVDKRTRSVMVDQSAIQMHNEIMSLGSTLGRVEKDQLLPQAPAVDLNPQEAELMTRLNRDDISPDKTEEFTSVCSLAEAMKMLGLTQVTQLVDLIHENKILYHVQDGKPVFNKVNIQIYLDSKQKYKEKVDLDSPNGYSLIHTDPDELEAALKQREAEQQARETGRMRLAGFGEIPGIEPGVWDDSKDVYITIGQAVKEFGNVAGFEQELYDWLKKPDSPIKYYLRPSDSMRMVRREKIEFFMNLSGSLSTIADVPDDQMLPASPGPVEVAEPAKAQSKVLQGA